MNISKERPISLMQCDARVVCLSVYPPPAQAQNAKVEGLKLQQQSPGTAPVPAPPTDSGSVQLLQQQLLEQQKEIEALKAAAK